MLLDGYLQSLEHRVNHVEEAKLVDSDEACATYCQAKREIQSNNLLQAQSAVVPDLLKRRFPVTERDRGHCSYIIYLWTKESWLYLALVIDLFSRRLVG